MITIKKKKKNNSIRTGIVRTCQVVQTSVIILHRQWLDLYDSPEPTDRSPGVAPSRSQSDWWRAPPASLLRECVLLLHRLLHHHAGFSASCRPLLHMYDQAIPALRDIFRKIPDLNESEGRTKWGDNFFFTNLNGNPKKCKNDWLWSGPTNLDGVFFLKKRKFPDLSFFQWGSL